MAYVAITNAEVDVKSPMNETLWGKVQGNFADHESRLGTIEGGGNVLHDYTTVGSVGDAAQMQAGHVFDIEQPGLATTDVDAVWQFVTGANLLKDSTANDKDLTDAGSLASADGIFGNTADDNCISLNGSDQYATQDDVWDDVGSAINFEAWCLFGDGQPATANNIFRKVNAEGAVGTRRYMGLSLETTGKISLAVANAAGQYFLFSHSILANGASPWIHIAACWDTTYGARLFINGRLENQREITTIMTDGTTRDFILGANNYGGSISEYMSGRIGPVRLSHKVMTQKDIDISYATRFTIPEAITTLNFKGYQYLQKDGEATYIRMVPWNDLEVARGLTYGASGYLYRRGGVFKSTDKSRILLGA